MQTFKAINKKGNPVSLIAVITIHILVIILLGLAPELRVTIERNSLLTTQMDGNVIP